MQQLPEESYDVFHVIQLTRGTALENAVAVDRVRVEQWKQSQMHRHNKAETILFMEQGSGYVVINNEKHLVKAEDRLCIPCGAWHSVSTFQDGLMFVSIQSPPIHDQAADWHDLEPFRKKEIEK